jgi:phytoene dehydrogenase-like protein
MSMARHFDAIVIGSGLGGLTAAALFARTGRRVLVLERNDVCGGAATVYRHGPLAIEGSLHEIDGLDIDDPKLPVLRSLGLDKDLAFVEVGDLYEVRSRQLGEPFALPCGMERALKAAVARFPHQSAALAEYFRRLAATRDAVALAARHQDDAGFWLRHAPEAVRRLWPLLREGSASVAEVLDELFGADEAVKLALAANLGYFHDDPARMSFVRFAIPQASYLLGGGHYIRGGSQSLTGRLVELIEEAQGVVETGRDVSALVLGGECVIGAAHYGSGHSDPRVDYAPAVFGNAAPQRLAEMLPEGRREAFLAPYANRRPSISLWTLSLGLSRPPAEFGVRSYSTFMLPPWVTGLAALREAGGILGEAPGTRLPPYVFVDYNRIDSGLNQAGPYLGSLCGTDRIENWQQLSAEAKQARKTAWMDRLVADLDREFPGIAQSVVHRELATAETMAHHLNTPDGAVYGFAPEREGINPLGMTARTTIAGLWLASAYVFGGGYTGAMMGGAAAAREVVRATEASMTRATARNALGSLS